MLGHPLAFSLNPEIRKWDQQLLKLFRSIERIHDHIKYFSLHSQTISVTEDYQEMSHVSCNFHVCLSKLNVHPKG